MSNQVPKIRYNKKGKTGYRNYAGELVGRDLHRNMLSVIRIMFKFFYKRMRNSPTIQLFSSEYNKQQANDIN